MFGDGHGGNGFHGLHGQGDSEDQASEDVVEAGENQGCGQGDAVVYGEGGEEGEEGAQVAQGAGELSKGIIAKGLEVVTGVGQFWPLKAEVEGHVGGLICCLCLIRG